MKTSPLPAAKQSAFNSGLRTPRTLIPPLSFRSRPIKNEKSKYLKFQKVARNSKNHLQNLQVASQKKFPAQVPAITNSNPIPYAQFIILNPKLLIPLPSSGTRRTLQEMPAQILSIHAVLKSCLKHTRPFVLIRGFSQSSHDLFFPPCKYLNSRGVAKFPAHPQKILQSTFSTQVPAMTNSAHLTSMCGYSQSASPRHTIFAKGRPTRLSYGGMTPVINSATRPPVELRQDGPNMDVKCSTASAHATKILLVDDDAVLRAMLRAALEYYGYLVTSASNGREALRKLTRDIPNIVLTDIMMPEQDGLETIAALRSGYPEIKIVAMSGGGPMGVGNLLDIAKKLGAHGCLAKPFNHDVLRAELERVWPHRPERSGQPSLPSNIRIASGENCT